MVAFILKAKIPKHKPGSPWENWWYNFAGSPFLHCTRSTQDHFGLFYPRLKNLFARVVLNRPTTDVDFWTAFLRGKDGWLQPLKPYATYSGVKLSGETRMCCGIAARLMEVFCFYQSQPLALCRKTLQWVIQFFVCLLPDSLAYQAIFFLRISVYISIKHRQIAAQSLKFALHNRLSIVVGCKLPWHKICWFQQSRNFQKEVEVVMSGVRSPFFPASRLDPSLDCRNAHSWLPTLLISRSKCDSIFQLLGIYGMCGVCSLVFFGIMGAAKVVEAPARDQRLRLTRGNYPSRTSSMK